MIESIILLFVGVLLLIIGVLIGVFHKITLLHEYHYKNVQEQNQKVYTRVMGTGLCLLGCSLIAAAAVHLITASLLWLAVLFGGFAIGFSVIGYAQRKYNGGFFA